MPSAGTYGNEEACNTNAKEFVYWTLIDKTQLTHDVHHYVLKQTTPVINIYIFTYNTPGLLEFIILKSFLFLKHDDRI